MIRRMIKAMHLTTPQFIRIAVPLIIVLGIAGAFIAAFGSADSPDNLPTPSASLVLGDTTFTLTEGNMIAATDVIGAGAVYNTDNCTFPEGKIEVHNVKSMSVEVTLNDDCSVEVVVVKMAPVTTSSITNSWTKNPQEQRYQGWTKSELNDFAGIDLTTVRAQMDYFDDNETVYGGRDAELDCDNFDWYQGSWEIESCTYSWSTIGPDDVRITGEGEFTHSLSAYDHWQTARFWGQPGAVGSHECGHSSNNIIGTHWKCTGDLEEVDD